MSALGSVVVFVGWSAGLGAVVWALRAGMRERAVARGRGGRTVESPRPASAVARALPLWFGSVALAVSTVLPWLRGTGVDGGPIELTAWSGLDVLSVGFVVVALAVLVAGEALDLDATLHGGVVRDRDDWMAGTAREALAVLAVCLLAVIGGNVLVQLDQPGGSRVAWGAWVATALAGAVAGASGWAWASRR